MVIDDNERTVVGGFCNYGYIGQGCARDEIMNAWAFLNRQCGPNAPGWVEVGHRKDVYRMNRNDKEDGHHPACKL